MAISLGELVAAAKQANDQPSVTDRYQNTVNHVSGALGSILGFLKGGKLGNIGSGQNGQQIASILNKTPQQ